jgi:phosphate transport system protein
MEKRILEEELEDLQSDVLRMGALVEKALYDSTRALLEDKADPAELAIAADDDIDSLNLKVQERCIRLLALRQPMASDLRAIQADLQVAMDLERMGDYSESIAKAAIRLHGEMRTIHNLDYLSRMVELVREMANKFITAYALSDIRLARSAALLDDSIDKLYKESFQSLTDIIKEDPGTAATAIQLLLAGAYLERIADHATNIGESVIYWVTGLRSKLND